MLEDYSYKTKLILIISLLAVVIYILMLIFATEPGCILPGPIAKCTK